MKNIQLKYIYTLLVILFCTVIQAQTISVTNQNVCYGETVTISLTGLSAGTKFVWQTSQDGGINWQDISEEGEEPSYKITVYKNEKIRAKAGNDTSNELDITVVKNELIFVGQNSFSVAENESFTLPTFDPNYTGTVNIYRSDNPSITALPGATISLPTAGTYTYIVKGELNTTPSCPVYSSIVVNVYGSAVDCTQGIEKVYPTSQKSGVTGVTLGNTQNAINAISSDLSINSTINITLALLGTSYQNLSFGATAVTANTPITVKLGASNSLLAVLGGLKIQPINQSGDLIGTSVNVSGGLLDLLTGDNVFNYTFVPLGTNGQPIAYHGVRISLASAVGLGNAAKVYGAYYEKPSTIDPDNCTTPTIIAAGPNVTLNNSTEDVSWGTNKILGIVGAVDGLLAPVINPYYAIDDNINTYAEMNINVGVAQAQTLTVRLRKHTLPGDQLRLILGTAEKPILDLNLIENLSVQRYLGNVAVGAPVKANSFFLDLNLLGLLGSTGVKVSVIIDAINQPFDRVEISYSSVVGVGLLGENIRVYDVAVVPGLGNNNAFCSHETFNIDKIDCSVYTVSMTRLENGNFVDIPNSQIASGYQNANNALYNLTSTYGSLENLYIKIAMKRQSCEYGEPRYLKVENCLGNESIINPVIKSGAVLK